MADHVAARIEGALASPPPEKVRIAGARDAAVLIPIVGEPEPTLIFTLRTDHLPTHRGQISFPGGAIDPSDSSPEGAALREAHEEIGLEPQAVRVLGTLDSVPTHVSGYVVHPVVGWLDGSPEIAASPHEVADVLFVPLRDLADDIRRDPGFTFSGRTYPTEAWLWNGNVIWGVTARVVRVFLERLAATGVVARPGGTGGWEALVPSPSESE
jgi:8-oxo-dGTP pyrophosphatase MutT (NUDIX family)